MSEGTENINRAIAEIIKPLRDKDIPAIIAGGFMRDNYIGKPWRDIDLYVAAYQYHEAMELLGGGPPDRFEAMLKEGDAAYDHQSIVYQEEFTSNRMDGALVNLIGLHETPTMEGVIFKFNLGICMAATDGFSALYPPAFLKDAADQQITLYREDWGWEATFKQWKKLQAKYPWPLRLAEPVPVSE
jgi:hypothetical protein